jgi:protein involved in polysaccharide export with SLBB domain
LGKPTTVNNIIQTSGRVGSDGSILLLEVGRLEALGKSINELRSEVRNILIRNGISPKFQLEISAFKSQKAYITITSNLSGSGTSSGKVIQLTDQPVTLREILSQLGIALKPGVSSRVTLQRSQSKYQFDMEEIYSPTATDLIIKDLDHIFIDEGMSNVIKSEVVVAYDGSIIVPDIGKLKVAGKTLKHIEEEIKNLSQNNIGNWKNFQILVTGFNSQKVIISVENRESSDAASSQIIPITNIPLSLFEAITSAGINIKDDALTKIHLTRSGVVSSLLLRDLLSSPMRKIYLEDGDLIRVQTLKYKPSKVFITGSSITSRIFNISPSNRETLADVLFTGNGVLSSNSAKKSEVYLLRGRDPVIAYHLDALSPSRLIVAESMELRPNDILFVAERPINSFNRTLQTILPLRILLRDIKDDNIP